MDSFKLRTFANPLVEVFSQDRKAIMKKIKANGLVKKQSKREKIMRKQKNTKI